MKKIVRTLYAATCALTMALMAQSCTNEPIEMERSVEITIMPEGTLAPFSAVKDRLEKMFSDEDGVAKVRLTILQYNSQGGLVQKKEALLKNFNERYTFSTMFPMDGKSRVICYASCIQGSLNNVIYEPYSIKNVDRIETITIEQNNFDNYGTSLSMLGWGECSISDNADDQLSIYMEPMVSFVSFHWIFPSRLPSTGGGVFGEYSARIQNLIDEEYYDSVITLTDDPESSDPADVLVKNFCPYFIALGYHVNDLKGRFDGSTLTIPMYQKIGLSFDKVPIVIVGMDIDTYEDCDIVFSYANGTLTSQCPWCSLTNDGVNCFELFMSGENFKQKSGSGVASNGEYNIAFSANDILKCNGISHVPSSSLEEGIVWVHRINTSDMAEWMKEGYTGYYADKNLFSCQKMKLYGNYIEGDEELFTTNQSYADIEAGQIYTIVFDCEAMTCELKNSVLRAPRLRESTFTRLPWLTTDVSGKCEPTPMKELLNAINDR